MAAPGMRINSANCDRAIAEGTLDRCTKISGIQSRRKPWIITHENEAHTVLGEDVAELSLLRRVPSTGDRRADQSLRYPNCFYRYNDFILLFLL